MPVVYKSLENEMAWTLVYVENCLAYLRYSFPQAYVESGSDEMHKELMDLIKRTDSFRNTEKV